MKSNVLAIIGAGEAAFPIIKKAKEMNVFTVAFGESDSVAKNEVDIFKECSIFDVDSILLECRSYDVSGVIASSEITTETTALVADKLSLPGNSVREGFLGRNKLLMRRKISSSLPWIRQPQYWKYGEQGNVKYPVVVKAIDSCGKRGVRLVCNDEELKNAHAIAEQFSSNGDALIEEYVEGGKEYSVECLANDKICTIVQITEKITSGPPNFAEISHHQPAAISTEMRSKIEKCSIDILHALGIICGMAHLELKVRDDEIFFIEVGARAGGDHIADTLTMLSTDFDYYKAAIECSFGTYQPRPVQNKSFSGIYFYCAQNLKYLSLFETAKNAPWCVKNTVPDKEMPMISSNCEAADAGYIIYCSDHKIGLKDAIGEKCYEAIRINDHPKVFELVWKHNKEIGRTLSDDELKTGIEKFIQNGNIIAVLNDDHILAFLMLYCNDYETLDAYICNVYVLEEFRGEGFSKKMLEKAIEICLSKGFKRIRLHVAEDNVVAISLYKKRGFEFTGEVKMLEEKQLEMILIL